MSNADWLAKKLGGGSPAPPPTTTTGTGAAPTQYPAQEQQQPAAPVDPENVKPGDPGSFSHALATGQTRGGDGMKRGALGEDCPGCGSGNYIKLKNGHRCYDCGYPVVQEFSELGEGTLAHGG